jgi:long-chain fatty acid transport protein
MQTGAIACSIALSFSSSMVAAQGFGINEQGACAMARGGAGVADSCRDGSATYLNPAGLADVPDHEAASSGHPLKPWVLSVGGMYVGGTERFTGGTGIATAATRPTPFTLEAYGAYRVHDKVVIGGGVYFPYGLGIEWPTTFEGRYVSYKSQLKTMYLQPTVSVELNPHFSIGGGWVVARSTVVLKRRQDLARVPLGPMSPLTFGVLVDPATDFADTELSTSPAYGQGFNVGALAKYRAVRVGMRYLRNVRLDYQARATFSPLSRSYAVTRPNPLELPVGTPLDSSVAQVFAALPTQDATTQLEMPAQFTAGIALHRSRLTVLADYQWVGWSVFDTIALDFSQPSPPDEAIAQNFRDTSAGHFGAEYEAGRWWRVRGGYFTNQAAAPDETVTPLLPEARRNHFTIGAGIGNRAADGWRGHLTIDAAYQYIHHADRQGRVVSPAPGELPTVALNSGVYRARGHLFALTLTVHPRATRSSQ